MRVVLSSIYGKTIPTGDGRYAWVVDAGFERVDGRRRERKVAMWTLSPAEYNRLVTHHNRLTVFAWVGGRVQMERPS